MKVDEGQASRPSTGARCMSVVRMLANVLGIALIMVPNTMYYASVNALSKILLETFKDDHIITSSSLLHSIPSIFSTFTVSFFTDILGVQAMLLPLQILIFIGCLCSALAKTSGVFLTGRLLYGLCGEGLIMVQSKLISNRISQRWHPFAFAITFCGFMLGESLASMFLGTAESISYAYFLIAGCMFGGFVLGIIYTILEVLRVRKEMVKETEADAETETGVSMSSSGCMNPSTTLDMLSLSRSHVQKDKSLQGKCKRMFTTVTDSIKTARPLLWIMVVGRLLFMGTKMGFDSTSVLFFSSILKLSNDIIVSAVGTSQIAAAVSFVLVGFLVSFWKLGPIIVVICGYFSLTAALVSLYFALSIDDQGIGGATRSVYLICVFIGISFGFFASNTSSVVVSLSDKAMSASGLGLVFSLQFLIMSIVVPLGTYISSISTYRMACWVYIAMLLFAGPFLFTVLVRSIIDYSRNRKSKKDDEPSTSKSVTSVLSIGSLDDNLRTVI